MRYKKIINGYLMLHEKSWGTNSDQELYDVDITYLCNEEVFANSFRYSKVSKKAIEKVAEKLEDYISYNRSVEKLCNAIPLLTIIWEIERIIYSCK